MENVGSISYIARIDTAKLKSDAKDVEKTAKDTGENFGNEMEKGSGKAGQAFKNFAKVAAIAVAAVGVATVAFAKKSVDAYNAATEAQTKLSTNLLNVKGNTEETVQSLSKLANQLQKVGVIEDDVIKAGMSQLATFNLQGATIEKLTPKITDMVAQLKGHNATAEDMVAINNLVGKVMNGNVGALSRYGVTLNETQALMLKNGTEAEKAATLVEVLGQNYGEVNKALRNTPQGRITALKNEFGDFQELVGEFTLKTLNPVVEALDQWLVSVGGVEGAFDKLISSATPVYNFFVNLGNQIGSYLSPKLKELWESVQNNLIPNLSKLYNEILVPLGTFLGTTLVVAIGFAIDAFTKIIDAIGWVITEIENGNPAVIGLAAAFTALGTALLLSQAFGAVTTALNVLSTTTIPAAITQMTALKLLITSPMVMGAIAVAAALAAIGLVIDAANRARTAIEQMQAQQKEALKISNEINARNAEVQASGVYSAQYKASWQRAADSAKLIDDQQKRSEIERAIQQVKNPLNLPWLQGRAKGGPVRSGMPYVVGENRDGSLNSTSELFIPRQNGSIVNSDDLHGMLGAGKKVWNIGTINIASEVDADRFLKRLTENQEIIGKGLTPVTSY